MRRRKTKNMELFDKTEVMDKELIDKTTLWMLRAILKSGGHREFIKDSSFSNDDVACFLDLEKFVVLDKLKKTEIIDILKTNLIKLEKRRRFNSSKLLTKNIEQLSTLMDLNNYEKEILEFFILINQYEILEDSTDIIGNGLNSSQFMRAISVILDIPMKEVKNAFSINSKFTKSSILVISKRDTYSLRRKVDFISDEFVDNMLNLDADIFFMLKDSLRKCGKETLKLDDFSHIKKDMDILIPYLKDALQSHKKGTNILFYGLPGTGKTELTKTLATVLETELYEVSYIDMEDRPLDKEDRVKAYKTAQALLKSKNTLLMYDEAEDIFESSRGGLFSPPKRQEDKAWINRTLESNDIPTIWITNNIDSIDNAIVRRFDMSIELPIPSRKRRKEILKKHVANTLEPITLDFLSKNENIAPALVSRAISVVKKVNKTKRDDAFIQVINNTLKAQGYKELKKQEKQNDTSGIYNPEFVNTTTNLKELAKGIKDNQNARLCLYGPAGTGKSAFGKYISEELDHPLHLKKGSDLLSKYIGETEQNIARAFEEAKDENAILVFDEVDSFLADRSSANSNWEITQVNEMLVQMENFDGVFIATTNLMNNLDKASLRRFDLKLEFDFLKSEQSWNMLQTYVKSLKLSKPTSTCKQMITSLKYLTPGDFAAVVRQNRFRPIKNTKQFIERLASEVEVKNIEDGSKMGFLTN